MSKPEETLFQRTAKNVISGTMAGIAGTFCGHPFDTLKVRLQTQPVHAPVYSGLADCFMKTLKWEGLGGLYKGVGSPLVGQMFFRATLFSSYYQINSMLQGSDRKGQRLHSYEYFLCGAYTGFFCSFMEGPIDLFKTKMQIQIIQAKSGSATLTNYRHVFHAGYVISRDYGVRGVYQGFSGTLLRNIPNFGIAFGVYEIVRDYYTPVGKTVDEISTSSLIVAAGCAGISYWMFTYPTDVIKSAMQSDSSDKSKRQYTGLNDCIRTLYTKEGGWKRFYRGYAPCMMRTIPANVAIFLTLEKCRVLLS